MNDSPPNSADRSHALEEVRGAHASRSDGNRYAICQCSSAGCRLRYPAGLHEAAARRCPACGAPVALLHHMAAPGESPPSPPAAADAPVRLAALLDNVRSIFNTGSIFRSADAAGFDMLHLCGVTPTPANRKLAKTALGAEQSVRWQRHPDSVALARELLAAGRVLWALEEGPGAASLLLAPPPPPGLVLVVGSEVTGIDPGLLPLCERTLAIPMRGAKRSLNVATAFGVAAVVLCNSPEPAT
jgi:tRNA G18 (ribose-2'-O)-methylase SpoU